MSAISTEKYSPSAETTNLWALEIFHSLFASLDKRTHLALLKLYLIVPAANFDLVHGGAKFEYCNKSVEVLLLAPPLTQDHNPLAPSRPIVL